MIKKSDVQNANLFSLVQRILGLVHGTSGQQNPELQHEYDVTIGSIIIEEGDLAEWFVSHLWYTIIDQRRDVKDFVIPIMATLMLSGFNADFVCKEPNDALELITAVLASYGHELKYSTKDNEALRRDGYYNKRTNSRSESIVKTILQIKNQYGWSKEPWQSFKEDILNRRSTLITNPNLTDKLVKNWPLISNKSFRFFLRDIEPILSDPEAIPIPIDTNVAQSIQKTGLMFDSWPPNPSEIIPVDKRGEKDFERNTM